MKTKKTTLNELLKEVKKEIKRIIQTEKGVIIEYE